MDRILSFGGGLQTTALSILVVEGKVEVDAAVFADTGAEKPETYWYIEEYIKPMLRGVGIPFITVRHDSPRYKHGDLYEYLWGFRDIPSLQYRKCTANFKIRPITKLIGKSCVQLIGFSSDEAHRAEKHIPRVTKQHPLIEMGLSALDCRRIIGERGLPIPLKSSCYICPFQPYPEWNWLKSNHPELFEKALELEARFHQRNPHLRDSFGLLRGTPLWKIKHGLQPEMLVPGELSCWSGYCSH